VAELDAADWRMHTSAFTRLVETSNVVGMELRAPDANPEGWKSLCRAWRAMLRHPSAIELISVDEERAVAKFAALDWHAAPKRAAGLANSLKLAHLFEHLIANVHRRDLVWFQNPVVFFDLRGEVRVLWQLPTADTLGLAPEVRKAWPYGSETSLVFTLGRLMIEVEGGVDPRVASLARRCLEPRSGSRIASVTNLRATLQAYAGMALPKRSRVWELTEEGIGWLELGQRERAQDQFTEALARDPEFQLAEIGRTIAIRSTILGVADIGNARLLEAGRSWMEAIDVYHLARHLMGPTDYLISMARCRLGLGQTTGAIDLATRASIADPSQIEPWLMLVKANLATSKVYEANVACRRLAAIDPALALQPLEEIIETAMRCGKYVEAQECTITLASLTSAADPERGVELLGKLANRIGPADALGLCEQIYAVSPTHGLQALVALATRLAPGTSHNAIAICERLHAISPPHAIQAFATTVEAVFQRGAHADALAIADRFVSLAPDAAIAHYRRGRCLLGLHRLVEAHAALVRAEQLDPKLAEAMLVRREVDRALANVRAVVGTAAAIPLHIPEHLTEVRAAMARGAVDEAAAWLEGHDLDDSARLLLGHLLVGQQRFADAVTAFDRVSGDLAHDAALGKARALSGLGRGEEALRILDRVCAENPDLTEAVVIRARVVAMLRGINPRA
jgi:tetratricopeptide (TPR) repeat protein